MRVKKVADAEKIRTDSVAGAEKAHAIAVATATALRWQSEVTARQGSLAAWHAVVATPWSAFQLALVNNEVAFINAHATAYVTRATASANAAFGEATGVSTAAKTRSYAKAEADWTRSKERLEAKATYWAAPAAARKTRALTDAGLRKTQRDDTAVENRLNSHNSADQGAALADGRSLAYHTADKDLIAARQFIISDDPMSPAYLGYEFLDKSDSVNISADLQRDLNQAEHDYRLAMLGESERHQLALIDISDAYSDGLRASKAAEAAAISLALEVYQKAAAAADKKHAVQTVQDQGVERNSVEVAHVTYVGIQALADEAYADEQARILRIQHIDDATAERTHHTAAAAAFVVLVGAWDTALNSRWSQYQLDLALAEEIRATGAANAKVTYVTAVGNSDKLRAELEADAQRILANAGAVAGQARTNSLVIAENEFAIDAGAARLTYAQRLAEIMRESADDAADQQNALETERQDFEVTQQRNSIGYETDYQEEHTVASLQYQFDAIAAWQTLAFSDGSPAASTQYQADLEDARDDFDATMQAAWDVLRSARADAIAARASFYIVFGQRQKLVKVDTQNWLVGERGVIELALAAAIKTETIELATGVRDADVTYAAAIANADAAYQSSVTTAGLNHRGQVKTAELAQTISLDIVNSAKRENDVGIRGFYEVGLFVDHAAQLAVTNTAEGTPLSAYQLAVGQADAALADSLRLARDAYQDELSYASHDYVLAVTAAEQLLSDQALAAEGTYQTAVIGAQQTLAIATGTAEAELYLDNVTAEAVHAEKQVIEQVAYDEAKALALLNLQTAVLASATTYAAAVGDALRQLYLDATDEGKPWGGPGLGGVWGAWGWGGMYGAYYGGWGFGGSGGYVFGHWSDFWGDGWAWGSYYGFGGFGYGGFGFGFGFGFGGATEAEQEDYQDAMSTAADARDGEYEAAIVIYVTAVGTAQIDRATHLGDAHIVLATARGDAGITYRSDLSTAENIAFSAEIVAANIRRSSVQSAEATYTASVVTARQTKVGDEEDANVGLKYLEGMAAVTAAGSRATAEGAHHHAVALDEADRLADIATVENTPQANFEALKADAFAEWVLDLSDDFVTRQAAQASADAGRAHNLAIAWRTRNNARETANWQFTVDTAAINASRIANEAAEQNAFATAAQVATVARNGANQAHLKTLEVALATAAKGQAVAVATAEKQYQLDKRGGEEAAEAAADARKEDLAEAQLALTTDLEGAKLGFQTSESTARQTYSGTVALAEKNRTLNVAAIVKQAAVDLAGEQAAVDAAFATAEENYWTDETLAENIRRAANALADVNYWTAEESERVDAAGDIDVELDSPWSGFLVDAASGHANWWLDVDDDYLQWIADRNTAESTWQTNVNAAHVIKANSINTARQDQETFLGEAARVRDAGVANARHTYVTSLLAPAKVYVDAVAAAESTHEVSNATALRDYTISEAEDRQETYNTALTAATNTRKDSLTSAENTYEAAEASALAPRLTTETNVRHAYNASMSLAIKDREIIEAQARRDYAVAESNQYLALTTNIAALDRTYWVFESQTLEDLGDALASSSPSPWMSQYAASLDANLSWSTGAAAAQEAQRVAAATDQSTGEIGLSDSDRDSALAAANADYTQALALANAAQAAGLAQASTIGSLGPSGNYKAAYPSLSAAPAVTGTEYAIAAASSADYNVQIADEWSNGFGFGIGWPYFGWGFGGFGGGFFGSGYFGGGFFGGSYFGGGLMGGGFGYFDPFGFGAGFGFGASSGGAGLTDPKELALPAGFWDLVGQAKAVVEEKPTWMARFEIGVVLDLVPENEQSAGVSVPSAPPGSGAAGATLPFGNGSNWAALERPGAPEPESPGVASTSPAPPKAPETSQHVSTGWFVNKVLIEDVAVPLAKALKDLQNALNGSEEEASPSDLTWKIAPTQQFGRFRVPQKWEPVDSPQNVANAKNAIKLGEKEAFRNDRIHLGTMLGSEVGLSGSGTVPIKFRIPVGWTYNLTALGFWQFAANYAPLIPHDGSVQDDSMFGTTARIGTLEANGWVAIDKFWGGGRATYTSIESLGTRLKIGATTDPKGAIRAAIASVRSPFYLETSKSNASLGLFVDGTGNHLESITNIPRLYNAYAGSKFYYGGVGNFIDWTAKGMMSLDGILKTGGNAFGLGTKNLVDRGVVDVVTYLTMVQQQNPTMKLDQLPIDIFGFSRGSAAAAELAKELSKGVYVGGQRVVPQVRVLGLYDPVYSVGLPGQGGSDVISTPTTAAGNYVRQPLAPNVRTLLNIAAQHEERTYFPGTRFFRTGPGQEIEEYQLPGAHCDVGGHYSSNLHDQQVALHVMVELARRNGVSFGNGSSFDWQLKAYYDNPYARLLVGTDGVTFNSSDVTDEFRNDPTPSANLTKTIKQFDGARLPQYWQVWSKGEFLRSIASTALDPTLSDWRPFALGVQIDGAQISPERQLGAFLNALGLKNFVFPNMDQYDLQHYERQLHNFKYTSDLYPEWGWAMRWIFHALDTKRAHLNGREGFDPVLPGQAP